MVNLTYMSVLALGLTTVCGVEQPLRPSLPEVVSARIIGRSTLTIKPCQPANVILEVDVERPVDFALWRRVGRALSDVVIVNGKRFRNRMPERWTLNDAAGFIIVDPAPASRTGVPPGEQSQARFLVEFFLTGKPAEYLFDEAGRYEIELLAGEHVVGIQVDVEEPTATERQLVAAIGEIDILFFLVQPTDPQYCTPETLALIERLAQQDTDYKKWLSLTLGLGLYHARSFDARDEEKSRALAEEVYGWLSPYCTGEITSRLEAQAAFWCGMHAWRLSKATDDKDKAAAYAAQQIELWRKVAESPYGFDEAAKAKQALAGLEGGASGKPDDAGTP